MKAQNETATMLWFHFLSGDGKMIAYICGRDTSTGEEML